MDDLISRQAAIDALDEIEAEVAEGFGFEYEKWRKYFCDLPPVQPNVHDLAKDADCISKQAAIDGKICIQRSNGVEIYDDYAVPVEYLEQLPPAQPAPSQVAKDIARIVENEQDMMVIGQPEIIRCKDCKYAEYIDDVKTLWCTECGQGRTVAPNDFCSYAERREETI